MYPALESGEAEVGIVVEDAWQSRGVGKLLTKRLAVQVRSAGEVFTCASLQENQLVVALVKALCPAATSKAEDGLRLNQLLSALHDD